MSKRQSIVPHLVSGGQAKALERIDFDRGDFDEKWLQELLFKHPSLIPAADIARQFENPLPLARELPTTSGPVDIVYVNPAGYLTLVETKLWRNPEARRAVVAQIIDYATAISKWSYADLCKAVGRDGAREDPVLAAVAGEDIDQSHFIDTVTRGLSRGEFLLLIAGDGIHEGTEQLAETLANSPHLRFSLALVELAVYRTGKASDDLLVQSRTLARTHEMVRAVVELKAGLSVSDVRVSLPSTESPGAGRQRLSVDLLLERLASSTSSAIASGFREFLAKAAVLGIEPEGRDSSVSLFWYEPNTEERFSFGSVYGDSGEVDTWYIRKSYLRTGLDENLGLRYIQALSALVPGSVILENLENKHHITRVMLKNRPITLADLLPHADEWIKAIKTTITETEAATAAKIENSG